MDKFYFSLFGRFDAHKNEENLVGLKANKLQEIIAYLLLYRDRPHNRERLASEFWGDSSTAQSKKYLRHNFWKLRQCLCDAIVDKSELLLMDGNWVSINPDANYSLDVDEFEQAYHAVQELPGNEISVADASRLKDVLSLYKSELLTGWYQDWCIFERERFAQIYLFMLDKLMGYCEAHEEYEEGIQYGNLSLRQDDAQERTHIHLMRLYYLSGNRSAAVRQYYTCEKILDEQLEVPPSGLTRSLFAQIKGDELPDADSAPNKDDQRTAYQMQDNLAHQLRKIQMELHRFQNQIDHQLNTLSSDV